MHDSGKIENHNYLFKMEIKIFPQFWMNNLLVVLTKC